MEIAMVISAIVSLIALICFFIMTGHVKEIRNAVIAKDQYLARVDFYAYKASGENALAIQALYKIIYMKVLLPETSLAQQADLFDREMAKYANILKSMGADVPENPFKAAISGD